MKTAFRIILVILSLLAIASGLAKVMLMPQEVDFFGRFGFSNPVLVIYGMAQLIGGVLLLFQRTQFAGAAIVAITFLVSLVVLLIDGNIPVSAATIAITLLLGVVMKNSWNAA